MRIGRPARPTGMSSSDRVFRHLLVDTLGVSVTHSTVWFAITFYVYLQTRSVFATGVIAGLFLVLTVLTGVGFGSLVDHHPKRLVMIASNAASLVLYAATSAVYLAAGDAAFTDPAGPLLWVFVVLLMGGVIVGNLRGIALSTAVTLLVPAERRDRANGLVGTASGVSFLVTSVISGLLVGWSGMFHALLLALVPAVEAAEQTVLQKVVPVERQGRVFGFAQSVEQAASPLTAFLISPLAQFVFIPFMTTGVGVDLLGGWFGTGLDRGLALVFVLTGLVGLAVTLAAFRTRSYRGLAARYAVAEPVPA